jgi:hypothetical protein
MLDATRVSNLEKRLEMLETRVTTLVTQSTTVQKNDDTQTIQLLKDISETDKRIEDLLIKLSTKPDAGGTTFGVLLGELLYVTYEGVTILLIVFLGVCLLWGIRKFIFSFGENSTRA